MRPSISRRYSFSDAAVISLGIILQSGFEKDDMKRGYFWKSIAVGSAIITLPLLAPQTLAFPHRQQIGLHDVRAESPLSLAQRDAIVAADQKVARSPSGPFRQPDQDIYLTNGGWRWSWLSLGASGAFAFTRPHNDAIVVGKANPQTAQVHSSALAGRRRSLDSIVAHEMTHGSIRAHFSITADFRYPLELREGYCDFVGGESTLSDQEATKLIAEGKSHPSLSYWRGRKNVEAFMQRPGVSVTSLFEDNIRTSKNSPG